MPMASAWSTSLQQGLGEKPKRGPGADPWLGHQVAKTPEAEKPLAFETQFGDGKFAYSLSFQTQ